MPQRLRGHVHHHLSAADERFGLRLGAGLVGTFVAAVTFALLLLFVRGGWVPLRSLDTGAAQTFRRIDGSHPELVRTAEIISRVFDPNVFRVALALIALVYLVRGERRHATWLLVTVFGGAGLGLVLKVDRRPGPPGPARSSVDGARSRRFRPAMRSARPSAAASSCCSGCGSCPAADASPPSSRPS